VSHGDTPIAITWSLKGDTVSSEPSITTTMIGQRTSILIISAVGYRHSGEYRCNAINDAGMASHSTELKVNGDCERQLSERERQGKHKNSNM
jgi:hypothetical protein